MANYTLYDLNEKKLSNITLPSNANGKIQLALWSPLEHVIVRRVEGGERGRGGREGSEGDGREGGRQGRR